MIILQFRMLSDENDNFLRDYEVPYGITLKEFHEFICSDLKFDSSEVVSFFTADKLWEKLAEFTSADMGEEVNSMADVKLSAVIHNNNDRLIYQFDVLEDRALYLELTGSRKGELDQPRVFGSEGEAPDQFEPFEGSASGSIFDDIMSDFDEFGGDDYSDDDY